jgi:hypothetical protein
MFDRREFGMAKENVIVVRFAEPSKRTAAANGDHLLVQRGADPCAPAASS